MNKLELEKAILKYQQLEAENQKEKQKLERLKELKETPEVKEYIELSTTNTAKVLTEKQMIRYSFPAGYANKNSEMTSGIYVYLGNYFEEYGTSSTLESYFLFETPNFACKLYANLESTEISCIPFGKNEDFENTFTVLSVPQCDIGEYGIYISSKVFWSFRDEYCRKLLTSPQKEVILALKKAYSKPKNNGVDLGLSLIKEL